MYSVLVCLLFYHCVDRNYAPILQDQALELGQKRGGQEMKWRRDSTLILFKAHIHKDYIELILAAIDVIKGVTNYRLDNPIIGSEPEVFLA